MDDEDYDEKEETDEDRKLAKLPQKSIKEVTLDWLISLIPEGITPDKIKIDFDYNFNCMAFEDHYIGFYYEVKVPARKNEYKNDVAKYGRDLEQYKKDLEAFKEYQKQEEINRIEAKLKELKWQKYSNSLDLNW